MKKLDGRKLECQRPRKTSQ